MRLLLRFYDVDSGAVLIDGLDVRELTQTSLRKQVGVVAQDTVRYTPNFSVILKPSDNVSKVCPKSLTKYTTFSNRFYSMHLCVITSRTGSLMLLMWKLLTPPVLQLLGLL